MLHSFSFFLQIPLDFSPNLSTAFSLEKTFKFMPQLLKLVIFLIAGSSPSSHSIITFLAIPFSWSTLKITTWWIFSRLPSSFSSLVVFFFYFIKPIYLSCLSALLVFSLGSISPIHLSHFPSSLCPSQWSLAIAQLLIPNWMPVLVYLVHQCLIDLQDPGVLSDCLLLLSLPPFYLWFRVLV